MRDRNGNVIEFIQGKWHPHVAMSYFKDQDGNFLELVKVDK